MRTRTGRKYSLPSTSTPRRATSSNAPIPSTKRALPDLIKKEDVQPLPKRPREAPSNQVVPPSALPSQSAPSAASRAPQPLTINSVTVTNFLIQDGSIRQLIDLARNASRDFASHGHMKGFLLGNSEYCRQISNAELNYTAMKVFVELDNHKADRSLATSVCRSTPVIDLTKTDEEDDIEGKVQKLGQAEDRSSWTNDDSARVLLRAEPARAISPAFTMQPTPARADHRDFQQSSREEQMEAHWAIMFTPNEAKSALKHPPNSRVTYDLRAGEYFSYPVIRSYHLGASGRYGTAPLPAIGGL